MINMRMELTTKFDVSFYFDLYCFYVHVIKFALLKKNVIKFVYIMVLCDSYEYQSIKYIHLFLSLYTL